MADWQPPPGLRDLLWVLAAAWALALLAALVLLLVVWRRLGRLEVSGGDFWQTLREVPLWLPVLLDLLDLGLDVFSAPIQWFLLRRPGLRALRDVATIEALIPVTGPLPTMTFCWALARMGVGRQRPPAPGGG